MLINKYFKKKILYIISIISIIFIFFRTSGFPVSVKKINENEYIQEPMVEIESQSLFKFLHEANYFNDLKTDKLFEKNLCNVPQLDSWSSKIKELLHQVPVYDKCQKNSPLTYIKENRLCIDDDVNRKFYNKSIVGCEFAPVIRSAIKIESYILGNYAHLQKKQIHKTKIIYF